MSGYQIWLADVTGARIHLLDEWFQFRYVRRVNDPGYFELTVPPSLDPNLFFRIDGRVQFWRRPTSTTAARLDTESPFLIRRRVRALDREGSQFTRVEGFSATEILNRRIVSFAAGSTEASVSGVPADDAMKDIVDQNMGPSASADRQFGSGFQIAGKTGAGPDITLSFSRRNVLDVLQEISSRTIAAGSTPTFFDVVQVRDQTLEFRTYKGQRGVDRGGSFLFSAPVGRIGDAALVEDYTEEITVVQAGGQGEAEDRLVVTVEDSTRSSRSAFGRREGWSDARAYNSTAGLETQAQARLVEGCPNRRLEGRLLQAAGFRYGVEWNFGDRLTLDAFGETFTVWVSAVDVQVTPDGKETVEGIIEEAP